MSTERVVRCRRRAIALEHLVTDEVTLRVVDDLEAVEVDEEHADAGPGAARVVERLAQALDEHGTVGETGERVVRRLVVQLALGAAALGDVGERAHHAVGEEVVVAQRPRVQRQPPLLAIRELDADQHVRERLAGAQRAHGRVLVLGDQEAVGVAGPQLLAEHGVEALADHDPPAEDALGGAVGGGDDALVVADDDALLERRDHGGVALLERAAGGFGAAALGDVGADGHGAGDLRILAHLLLVHDERDGDAHLEQGPVRAAVHRLEVLRRLEPEAGVGARRRRRTGARSPRPCSSRTSARPRGSSCRCGPRRRDR